jgi:hypothetical protein
VPTSLQYPLERERDLERRWNRLLQRTAARRAPKHIFNAHPPDQCSQIGTDLRAASQVSRFATPVSAKTGTMPAHHGLGPDDRDRLENRWKPAIQLG